MDRIVIEGGRRLTGEVAISGSKNAALPILFASMLVDGWVTITNVPALRDIDSTVEILEHLGCRVERENGRLRIDASGFNSHKAPYDLVRKMRASILVLGPMLARLKRARVSLPGGCAIGARPINLHLQGLKQLGARIELKHGNVYAFAERLIGAEIYFDTATVGGTENLMMAAVLAKGTTVLKNAAREPEIVALADALNAMGAHIRGAGTSEITIDGVPSLRPAEIRIIPDRIETGTYMVAAAVTGGDVTLTGTHAPHLDAVIEKLRATGSLVDVAGDTIRVRSDGHILPVDIRTQPHPGFPTDMQAQFMVLAAMADGQSIITETIFENRFIHVSELKRMGADITVTGNTAMIKGGGGLSGAPVMASDLRASASLVLAGLVATGYTQINRVYHLDRGYESLEKKLLGLGATIRREAV